MQIADASAAIRHVFLRNMILQARIGIYPHEHQATQRVRLNVDLGVSEASGDGSDRLDQVVDYEHVAKVVSRLVTSAHFNLVETLATQLAAACLSDERIRLVRIRVEKLDVFPDTEAVGVEIERRR